MKNKIIIAVVLSLCVGAIKGYSQQFDSLHVYAVYMKSQYRVKIDKDLIKNEVDPIILTDQHKIDSVYSILRDKLKHGKAKTLQSNHLDIRLSFEFFKGNNIAQVVGVTPYNTMFINYDLYAYDRQNLKYLDKYITGLSKKIGLKN